MSDIKQLSLDDVRRDLTGSSGNTGREFGTLGRFPIVKERSGSTKYPCGNEDCPASEVRFDHVVNRIKGELESFYNWEQFEFTWDPNLNEFRLTGHYCPICGRFKVDIDGETVIEEEGDI